jgi:ABC-2 type transport system permease protein
MNAHINHFLYDFRVGLRDKGYLLMIYIFPLAVFAMLGTFMTPLNPFFKGTMIPGMTVFAVMSGCLLNLPENLISGRDRGIFRSFRINGIGAAPVVFIPSVGLAAHLLIVAGLIALAGSLVFNGTTPANWSKYASITLLAIASYAAIGSLIGVVSPNGRFSMLIGQLFFLPSTMIGGLFMPMTVLPPLLIPVARFLPASHIMRLYTEWAMTAQGTMPWGSLAVLASTAILAFAGAYFLFEWDPNNPRRRKYRPVAILAIAPLVVSAIFGI